MPTCDNCSEEHETLTTIGDLDVCQQCAEDAPTCDDCGEASYSLATVRVPFSRRTHDLCHDCICVCSGCGEHFHRDDMGGEGLCQPCYDDTYTSCAHCGDSVERENASIGMSGELYCSSRCVERSDDCESDSGPAPFTIYDYGDKVSTKPRQISNRNDLCLGVELECESNGNWDSAPYPPDEDWLLVKHDGSLDNGMELVTSPISRRWLRAKGGDGESMINWLQGLAKAGFTAWEANREGHEVGIHVHAPKDALTGFELSKLCRLVYGSPRFFASLSGRGESVRQNGSFASLDTGKAFDSSDWESDLKNTVPKTKEANGNRYVALNLCNNKTIEFRLFRSSLKPERLHAYMDLVESLIEFVRAESWPNMVWEKFCAYIQNQQPSRFRHMRKIFEKQLKGII